MATPIPNLSICSSDICADHGRLVLPPGGTKWWCTSMAAPRTFSFTARSWPNRDGGASDAAPLAANAPRNRRLLVIAPTLLSELRLIAPVAVLSTAVSLAILDNEPRGGKHATRGPDDE